MYFNLMSHCRIVVFIFFLASIIGAQDSGRITPAGVKRQNSHSPLFSVSGTVSRDSIKASAPVLKKAVKQKAVTTKDSLKKHDSLSAKPDTAFPLPKTEAVKTDTSKAPPPAAAADSIRNMQAKNPTATLIVNDHNDRVKKPSAIGLPSSQKAVPIKKLKARSHGIDNLFDIRYGMLLLSIIIIGLYLRYVLKKGDQPAFVTTTRLSIMDKEVQTACRYIEKNYKNPQLSLETVCEALVTGKAFLDALFHQELSLSVEEFIRNVRINRARMLFEKNTSLDADSIAEETGFRDVQSFVDAFTSIVGVPFERYRDVRKKNAS
jgi:AraC-like DNA-binding protein